MRMGHAMVRPKVGAIFSAERRRLAEADGRLLFAHSDLSGFSISRKRSTGVFAPRTVRYAASVQRDSPAASFSNQALP